MACFFRCFYDCTTSYEIGSPLKGWIASKPQGLNLIWCFCVTCFVVMLIYKRLIFYNLMVNIIMYRQIWVDVFLKYNTLSSSSSAVERLFFRGAAILTAK